MNNISDLLRFSHSGLFGRAAEKVCSLWEEGVGRGMVERSKALNPGLVEW